MPVGCGCVLLIIYCPRCGTPDPDVPRSFRRCRRNWCRRNKYRGDWTPGINICAACRNSSSQDGRLPIGQHIPGRSFVQVPPVAQIVPGGLGDPRSNNDWNGRGHVGSTCVTGNQRQFSVEAGLERVTASNTRLEEPLITDSSSLLSSNLRRNDQRFSLANESPGDTVEPINQPQQVAGVGVINVFPVPRINVESEASTPKGTHGLVGDLPWSAFQFLEQYQAENIVQTSPARTRGLSEVTDMNLVENRRDQTRQTNDLYFGDKKRRNQASRELDIPTSSSSRRGR